MIGNSLTEDTGSAQRYHAEDQHEQRNGFTKADHGDILREALAGFRQGVRACGASLALYDGRERNGKAGGDSKAEQKRGICARRLHLLHQEKAVDGLRQRCAGEYREDERSSLIAQIALLPCEMPKTSAAPNTPRFIVILLFNNYSSNG